MSAFQQPHEVIDVAEWPFDEDWFVYPEGTRDKRLYYSPTPSPYSFCHPKHKYLFKCSSPRYPEQFWMEIFAYQLGQLLDVVVPPAYFAIDSRYQQCGALIEWFHLDDEIYVPGGDIMQLEIPNYDRRKGTQHNFTTIAKICARYHSSSTMPHDWKIYWAKILLFDALIGNTDRHQDNWGLIYRMQGGKVCYVRLTPVFDNGTSMGHELQTDKLDNYRNERLQAYIKRGRHHLKWYAAEDKNNLHGELLLRVCQHYPSMVKEMQAVLKLYDSQKVHALLQTLTSIEVPVPLTSARAKFMLQLLDRRFDYLSYLLENCDESHLTPA